ncbi:MAG: ParB/RepB/Spo0J family partition protein [Clostridia bacterium]|nr:ParB/RepB/Spo0J family partition protein [Clostridia bacterium]
MKENKQENVQILYLEVEKIAPNPNQPRKAFSDDGIIKLADSIRQYGIIQPLCVRKIGDEFELISGERRLRAAKELGLERVPCVISLVSEEKSSEMAIIENLMREDLTIFEEAEAIQSLIDIHNQTQEKIAEKLSVSQSYIANKLRLLRLSREERAMILRANLTERHARALLRIRDDNLREKALSDIISKDFNVAETEAHVEKLLCKGNEEKVQKKQSFKSIDGFYEAISRAISSIENSGIKVKQRKIENDSYTEITILVPKSADINAASSEQSD